MSQIIANLNEAGFETHSYYAAARQANEKYATISRDRAIKVMNSLFGFHVETENDIAASIALRYMIAESVRKHVEGFVVTQDDVHSFGVEKTKEFFIKNPWKNPDFHSEIKDIPTADEVIDVPVEEIKIARKNVAGKTIKPKKGLKQEAAKKIYEANRGAENHVIIELFMKQLDMSKAGATTYLYNIKKAMGEPVGNGKRGRKPKAKNG